MKDKKKDAIGILLQEMSTQAIRRSNLVAAILGINSTDLEALEVLLRIGKSPAGVLATETGISAGAVTKMIDRLEKANFVSREYDKIDRRKVFIVLNKETINAKIFPLYQSLNISINTMLSQYSEKELDIISGFLEKSLRINNSDLKGLEQK